MKQAGLSLVELMVVVLLIGILALLSTPLTSSWVNSARVGEAMGAFEQAVGQAKAAALRNPAAIQGSEAASVMCLGVDGVLSVKSAAPAVPPNPVAAATCSAGGPAALWSTRLPDSVEVKSGVQDWSCSCFTNKGLLTTAGITCAACGNSLKLTISSGAGLGVEDETLDFY